MQLPFTPGISGTIAATETSASLAISSNGPSLYVYNTSDTNEVFITWGDSTVTAVAGGATTGVLGSMSVGPRAYFVVQIGLHATYLAAICAAGQTATLRFSRGDGE